MACQPVEVKLPYRDETNGGLLCTTSEVLFGPLFKSIVEAAEFCDWLRERYALDPRRLDALALSEKVDEFRWRAEFVVGRCRELDGGKAVPR